MTLAMFAALVTAADDQPETQIVISERDYTIRDGETLRGIAQRELGKIGLAPHLAEFNNIALDSALQAGQVIQIPLYAEVEKEFATVVFVKGNVRRDGQEVARNAEIYVNELLTTGDDGFVSIMFKSGTVVNLQSNANAKLKKLNCLEEDQSCVVEVEADQGELTSNVESDLKPSDFRISTPYASAAVRGTVFDVSVTEEALGVGVTEGGVAIANDTDNVDLNTGFGSVTKRGQALGQPVPLLPSPVYRYIPTRAATGDRVLWWNLSNVDDYVAQLTSDIEGRAVLAESIGKATDFVVGDVEAGDYYLNVRGVDQDGLKGFTSSTRVTVAQIDESLQPVDTEISFDGNEYLVSVQNPSDQAPGYEIQVSSDPNFDDPLSVDINQRGAAVFRLDVDKLYARTRMLIDPRTVSAFGATAESP